jgi:hypothetical protein
MAQGLESKWERREGKEGRGGRGREGRGEGRGRREEDD